MQVAFARDGWSASSVRGSGPLMDHLARLDGVLEDLSFAQIGGAVGLRNTPEGQGGRVCRIGRHLAWA